MKNPEISLLCGPAKFADVLIHSKLASSRYCFDSHCNANGSVTWSENLSVTEVDGDDATTVVMLVMVAKTFSASDFSQLGSALLLVESFHIHSSFSFH